MIEINFKYFCDACQGMLQEEVHRIQINDSRPMPRPEPYSAYGMLVCQDCRPKIGQAINQASEEINASKNS